MLITTHIAATTAIMLGASEVGADLNLTIIAASYVLGVAVDLDHAIFYWQDSLTRTKQYVRNRKEFKLGETKLHTHFQEPFTFLVVFGLSTVIFLFSHNLSVFLPAICFGVHIFMDSLVDFDNYLLWPYSKKSYKGPYKQNVVIEGIVGTLLSVVFIIAFLSQLGIV